ncbi:DUF6879 family protein [Streptomyces sp. NPDC020412]|uniref:DUF6879 family protein n=1 Tax=Streptomyces sp. NPDC020412 TaxID=3365073 RepID=UPI00378FEAB8
MGNLTPFAEVSHLFQEFKHTAWRLETRQGYASDRRGDKWQRWLNGEDVAWDPGNRWRHNVRSQTAAGKKFGRVRIVDDPPTEGQRYLLDTAPGNVEAGEDIRNLPRAEAKRLGLPEFDFWLLDSRLLMKFHFDNEDTTLGVELIEAVPDVLAACQARDAAWHYAIRTHDFRERVRSSV